MPDEFGRLPENVGDGVKSVVIAIAARKDDNANFMVPVLGRFVFILTDAVGAAGLTERSQFGGIPGRPGRESTAVCEVAERTNCQVCGIVVRAWVEEANLGLFGCWVEGRGIPIYGCTMAVWGCLG